MNKELQEKLHYYPTGLKAIHNGKEVSIRSITKKVGGDVLCGYDVLGDTSPWKSQGGNDFVGAFKFHMRPLTSLTKPITVQGYNDGNEFVPMEQFDYGCIDYTWKDRGEWIDIFDEDDKQIDVIMFDMIENTSFHVIELLFRWHFWIGDQSLFASGEIIEIKD